MLSIWQACHISSYQRMVRTNNDLEGYHNRLNLRSIVAAKKHVSIPNLIKVLYEEAKLVKIRYKMVSSSNVMMHRKKKTLEVQAKLCELWDQYDGEVITRQELMEGCVKFSAF